MTMHGAKMKFNLEKSNPTEMTVSNLKRQLTNIGLTCSLSDEENLKNYIDDVRLRIPQGTTSACFIGLYDVTNQQYASTSNADWTISDTAPQDTKKLKYLCKRTSFDLLKANQADFDGSLSLKNTTNRNYGTLNAIKKAFIDAAVDTSATLVNSLDPKNMESALTHMLSPITDENDSNYNTGYQEVHFIILKNYNENEDTVDAAGFLGVGWQLKISDYKEKKESLKHKTEFEIQSWSGFYQSWEDIDRDYDLAYRLSTS